MNKILKFIFLIIIFWVFLVRIANAQGFSPFYVKFIDANDNGFIDFRVTAHNNANQTYYTGVATTDHTRIDDPLLQIPAGKTNSTSVSWSVNTPGEFLIYDVYLTSDFNTYYWTSQGDAFSESRGKRITIYWKNKNITMWFVPTKRDDIQITAVPLPSALWLLGSGAITLGLIRKKLLTC